MTRVMENSLRSVAQGVGRGVICGSATVREMRGALQGFESWPSTLGVALGWSKAAPSALGYDPGDGEPARDDRESGGPIGHFRQRKRERVMRRPYRAPNVALLPTALPWAGRRPRLRRSDMAQLMENSL